MQAEHKIWRGLDWGRLGNYSSLQAREYARAEFKKAFHGFLLRAVEDTFSFGKTFDSPLLTEKQ